MDLSVEVKKDFHNTISITEYIEPDVSDYIWLNDETEEYNRFEYQNRYSFAETCSIAIVYRQTSASSVLECANLNTHDEYWKDSLITALNHDGYYTVHYIVLPTQEWIEQVKQFPEELNNDYNYIYYVNTIDQKVYRYYTDAGGYSIAVNIEEIVDMCNVPSTTISSSNFSVFCTHFLEQCYIKAARALFNNYDKRCQTVDQNVRFNRDFVWMTLNVINYLLEDQRYTEAQLILEDLSCYNFCGNGEVTQQRSNCGCHH